MTRKVGRIRDVAKATGLSTATISRVMNGATNVLPATRARVLAACDALNYLPDPAARALTTRRSKTVAAIIPSIEHSIYAKFIAAIEQALSARGYALVLALSMGREEDELAAARKLLGMGAEAFILSGAEHSPELRALFERRGVPFVFTSVWQPENAVPTIGYDNFALAHQAVEHIAARGHREIAVVHGPLADSDRTRSRRRGAEAARAPDRIIDCFETSLDVGGGKTAVRTLLEGRRRYTALLCFSDILALGAYFALAEAGLRIPEEMSVMGFDNLDWSEVAEPALSTVNLPARKMGAKVAEQLMSHLETGAPLVPTELPGTIVERGSIARRPG